LVAMSLIVVETHHRLCTETTHRDRTEHAVIAGLGWAATSCASFEVTFSNRL
jgi:hypothetical protein